MLLFSFFAGLGGFFFCTAFQSSVDLWAQALQSKFLSWRQGISRSPAPPDLWLISRLVASIRAGISLDGALESIRAEKNLPRETQARIHSILQLKAGRDFLSLFLVSSLQTGAPILATLLAFQKLLQAERRVKMRARALTSQSRAQGEVLSWLPWVMGAALGLMDPAWLRQAAENSLSWLAAAAALLLLGLGRRWMKSLLDRALRPTGREELLQEEILPALCLQMVAQLSVGLDAETALERSLVRLADEGLKKEFQSHDAPEIVRNLKALLGHAAHTGAPLRDDLLGFLSDLHLQTENRWEERVQRLPVLMMAPLFLCFFPSTLLVLGAFLLPLARDLA